MCCVSESDPLKYLKFRKKGVIKKPKIDFRTSVPACIADEGCYRHDGINKIFDFFLFFANQRIWPDAHRPDLLIVRNVAATTLSEECPLC